MVVTSSCVVDGSHHLGEDGLCSFAVGYDTVAVGSHGLEMEGHKKLVAVFRPGECIRSGSFLVGGHSWHFGCYPRGSGRSHWDWEYVEYVLCLENPCVTDQVKARFGFVFLGPAGESVHSTQDMEHTFSSTDASFLCDFCDDDASGPEYLESQRFSMRCDVIIVKEFKPWSSDVFQCLALPYLEGNNLHDLLVNGGEVGGDVTFQVSSELFTAHKYILAARSPVFMAEFFGPDKETAAAAVARIKVDDNGMDPKVFKAFLHFIYTDTLPKIHNNIVKTLQGLIVASDRYGMGRLKLVCDDVLCYRVDASTAATMLKLADKHGCPRLKHACTKFLRDLLDSVAR